MRSISFGLAVCVALPTLGWAEATEEEKREACTPDVMEFCASEIPNRTRIAQCLETKRTQISAECRAVLDGGRPASRQN